MRAEGAEAASSLLYEYAHAMASHILLHCPAYHTMVGATLSNQETKHTLTCTQVDTVVRNVTNTENQHREWALWYDLTMWFIGICNWLPRGMQERKEQNRVLKKPENTLSGVWWVILAGVRKTRILIEIWRMEAQCMTDKDKECIGNLARCLSICLLEKILATFCPCL